MKISPFLYLLFGLFLVAGCAQEGVCADLSAIVSTDTLNRPFLQDQDEVKKLSAAIRNASKAKTFGGVERILSPIMEEKEVFGGKYCIIKYGNPEIHDAVVDLVLELNKMVDTPAEIEWLDIKGSGEYGPDWVRDLRTAAESTFSPRLHGNELYPFQSTGKLRMEYLARVLPSKTLDIIINSFLLNGKCNALLVSSPEKKRLILRIDDAMELISKIRETAPDVVNKNKEGIRKFIKLNIISAVQEPGWAMRDFDARTTAMNILASFNATQDIPLIQQLANESIVVKNSKVVDDERNPRRIKELAERLCKQLKESKKIVQ
jgi:hypothetical protein